LSTHVKKAFEEKDDWKTVGKVTQGQAKTLKRSAKKVRFEDENKWKVLEDEDGDALETVSDPTSVAEDGDKGVGRTISSTNKNRNRWKQLKTRKTSSVMHALGIVSGPKSVADWEEQGEKNELMIFRTIWPEGLNPMTTKGGWEMIELAVDSGATETVVGEDMLKSIETKESWGSKKGVEYEVANGETIPNLGEKKFHGVTDNGITRNLTAQVCEVNKALLSVKKIISAGNRVTFDEDGSFIEDKSSGEKMWLKDEGGMFLLKMWVKNSVF